MGRDRLLEATYGACVPALNLLGHVNFRLHTVGFGTGGGDFEVLCAMAETLPSGAAHKGRVLKLEGQKLLLPESQIESTIDLWLFFTPDLPLDIVLEDRAKPAARYTLPAVELRRLIAEAQAAGESFELEYATLDALAPPARPTDAEQEALERAFAAGERLAFVRQRTRVVSLQPPHVQREAPGEPPCRHRDVRRRLLPPEARHADERLPPAAAREYEAGARIRVQWVAGDPWELAEVAERRRFDDVPGLVQHSLRMHGGAEACWFDLGEAFATELAEPQPPAAGAGTTG